MCTLCTHPCDFSMTLLKQCSKSDTDESIAKQTNKQKTTIIVSLQSPPTVLGLVSQSVPVLVRTPLCSLAMWKRTVEHRSSFLPKARQHAPISFSPVVHLSSVSAAARGWDRLLGLHILFMWRL